MKILLIGVGGYVDAVVIPTLKRYFPGWQITLYGHDPVNSYNVAQRHSVIVYDEEPFKKYDIFFLTVPFWDYKYFIDQIPNDRLLWLEKPLEDIEANAIERFHDSIRDRIPKTFIGMNRRQLLENSNNELYLGQINGNFKIPVDYSFFSLIGSWKHSMIKGGIFYTDGIHAIDLALLILSDKVKIVSASFDRKNWQFLVKGTLGKIEVTIGDIGEEKYMLNDFDLLSTVKNENVGQTLFLRAFKKFLDGHTNVDSVFENTIKFRDAITKYNLLEFYR